MKTGGNKKKRERQKEDKKTKTAGYELEKEIVAMYTAREINRRVAQLVERSSYTRLVAGSSPAAPTKIPPERGRKRGGRGVAWAGSKTHIRTPTGLGCLESV